jgi:MoxR-like ATPase
MGEPVALMETGIQAPAFARQVEASLRETIVGQDEVIERLLVALLAGGHVLLEGVPGLAKTLLVRTLARSLEVEFRRIQFTPDLLPSDVLGTLVLQPEGGRFAISRGPIFANVVLADEVNRAPAKVQSALLEAMEEGQVTLGGRTMPLPDPFLVLATQNPLEHQGTYPLAEAQLDRFLLMLRVRYPRKDEEVTILRRGADGVRASAGAVATAADVRSARQAVRAVRVDDRILEYAVALVRATREPASAGLPELQGLVGWGASPRAGLGLVAAGRARAWLRGRDFVLPEDLKALAPDVLRHRLVLTYEASVRGVAADEVVGRVLDHVTVP